jgi:GrpB-like predicted nucleotidyltransferase (UPF0157 family)
MIRPGAIGSLPSRPRCLVCFNRGSPRRPNTWARPRSQTSAPIVDIVAPVRSLAEAQDAVPVLERDGWLFWADDPNRSYRLWFLRPTPAARTHHLYLMQHDHPELRNVLLLRDALRNSPALRQEYAALKDRLAEQHPTDRDAYTDAKSDFVRSVLEAAGAAPSSRRTLA